MIIYAVTWLDHTEQGRTLNTQGVPHRLISYYHSSNLSEYIKEYVEKGIIIKKKEKC